MLIHLKETRQHNDYDTDHDIYIHHLRFRIINAQGGFVTLDHDLEVDLYRPRDHGNPYHVQEMP